MAGGCRRIDMDQERGTVSSRSGVQKLERGRICPVVAAWLVTL